MKIRKITLLLILAVSLFLPTTAYAKEPFDDKVVFGGTFTLESGQSLDGNLVIFGGAVTTEADSRVNGDVALIGGVAEINGEVNGSVVGIGGAVQVNETAVVNGDLVTIGATLSRAEGARVNGQIINGMEMPFAFTGPSGELDFDDFPMGQPAPQPQVNVTFNPLLEVFWFFFRTFMWSLMAVLLVMFFADPVERVSSAAIGQPLISWGAGLLTAFLTPMALIALTLTIILIPVTLVATFVLIAAWLFGWVALGAEVGKRIAKQLNMEWAPAICAGVGTFTLFFVLGGFSSLIPCVGWIPQVLVGLWGLGAVILTRFGTQDYPGPITPSPSGTDPALGAGAVPAVVVPELEKAAETPVEPVVSVDEDSTTDEDAPDPETESGEGDTDHEAPPEVPGAE